MRITDTFFDAYRIGNSRTTTGRTITETDIVLHAGQTGDFYPHHMDAEWAATQPIGERVAHGTLVMAVAVGMTADDINPRAMSYGYDRVRFVRPVHIGDTIRVTAEITGKRDHDKRPAKYGYVEETVTVRNQHDNVVLALIHVYLVEKK